MFDRVLKTLLVPYMTVNTKTKELKQELLYVIIMSRARFRVSLHSVFAIQKYFEIQKFFRGHSKITSPRKCQILDLSSFYVAVSHFFHYTSSPCHQANSDKLFPWSKTLNRSTNEPVIVFLPKIHQFSLHHRNANQSSAADALYPLPLYHFFCH